MNKKALLKKYLLISNFYKKPFPYSLLKELGFSKSDIPASYMVRRDYVFNKDYNNSQIKQLTQSYKSETRNKKKLAQIFLFPLYILPFVYMIGISGSVAMETPRGWLTHAVVTCAITGTVAESNITESNNFFIWLFLDDSLVG